MTSGPLKNRVICGNYRALEALQLLANDRRPLCAVGLPRRGRQADDRKTRALHLSEWALGGAINSVTGLKLMSTAISC